VINNLKNNIDDVRYARTDEFKNIHDGTDMPMNLMENMRGNNDNANFDNDPLNLDGTIDPPGTDIKQKFN
jgi:hypothetical protein